MNLILIVSLPVGQSFIETLYPVGTLLLTQNIYHIALVQSTVTHIALPSRLQAYTVKNGVHLKHLFGCPTGQLPVAPHWVFHSPLQINPRVYPES